MRRLAKAAMVALVVASAASAVAGNQYEDAALAKAWQLGLTAKQVAARKYPQVAQLAGVTLGPQGQSPPRFFYKHVQRHVVRTLARESREQRIEQRRLAVRAKLRELFPKADIEIDREKNQIIITGIRPDPQEDTP